MGFCLKCKEKWTGANRCHCTGCHRTFHSVGGFDKHRKNFKCLDPIDLGMEMDEKGIWSTKMSETLKNRLRIIRNNPLAHVRKS